MTVIGGKKVYRYARLTPEREAKITELVQLMRSTFNPLPKQLLRMIRYNVSSDDAPTTRNSTRVFCYCFLQAREWSVPKALEMMKQSVEYRKANKLDERSELPPAMSVRGWDTAEIAQHFLITPRLTDTRVDFLFNHLRHHFKMGFHYWDRNGLPTLYVMLGEVRPRNALRRLKQVARVGHTVHDAAFEMLQHVMGVGESLVWFQQNKLDRQCLDVDASEGQIRSVNIVLDMRDLNYKHLWKPAIDVMRSALYRLFLYYPDCVHRILAVNCPPMVLFAYKVVRSALPASVQRKVSFATPAETLGLLSTLIDPQYIPSHYGGSCDCADTCVFAYDPVHATPQSDEETSTCARDDVLTETIRINAGCDYVRVFTLAAEETVAWEFASTESKGVLFRTYFVPAATAAEMRWARVSAKELSSFLVSKDTPVEGADAFVATEAGTLVLLWDNRRAWFSQKRVQMRVYKEICD